MSRGRTVKQSRQVVVGLAKHVSCTFDPVLTSSAVTNISTSASVLIPRPREEVFEVATDSTNAADLLRSRGPFAGISKVELYEGQTLTKGARRRITMTDGAVLEEVILDYEPPVRHRYGWTGGAQFPFSLLVRSGTGNWDFTEEEGGTRIVWTYTFVSDLRPRLSARHSNPLALQRMVATGPRRHPRRASRLGRSSFAADAPERELGDGALKSSR